MLMCSASDAEFERTRERVIVMSPTQAYLLIPERLREIARRKMECAQGRGFHGARQR
jgi:hypothetical protein